MPGCQRTGTKICSKCGEALPATEFYKDSRREDGLRSVCKACWAKRKKEYRASHKEEISESDKQYYLANKERINKRIRKWRKDNHQKLMEQQQSRRQCATDLLAQLKTPCVRCGEARIWVIQFHHIEPGEKVFEISCEAVMHKPLETIKEEARKCACLCANCHTEFHHFHGKNPAEPRADFEKYIGGNLMRMRGIPDHPEVAWALRTGYPSWMQETDHEDEDDDFEEPETIYED